MTLAPSDNWNELEAAKGDKLVPNPVCSVPGCGQRSTDGHHIWRRSFTVGPTDWVLIDGLLVANKTWLCVNHHAQVTGGIGGHRAWIRWHYPAATYHWWQRVPRLYDNEPLWEDCGPLVPQPQAAAPPESFDEPAPEPDHICPKCGKVHRHRHKRVDVHEDDLEKLPPRKKTRFQIMVPQDQQEDGVEVLFDLLDGLAPYLHTAHFDDHYYWTLVKSLALLSQNQHLITEEES